MAWQHSQCTEASVTHKDRVLGEHQVELDEAGQRNDPGTQASAGGLEMPWWVNANNYYAGAKNNLTLGEIWWSGHQKAAQNHLCFYCNQRINVFQDMRIWFTCLCVYCHGK